MSTCCDLLIQLDAMDENVNVYFARMNAPFYVKRLLGLEIPRYALMIYMIDQSQLRTAKTN